MTLRSRQRWDAVRFHCCLLWTEGTPAPLDERDLAETVQSVLVDQVERWAAGVFDHCAETADSRVPGGGWAGPAARLLATVPYELRRHLSPRRFAPDRAAALFADCAAEAAHDLGRLRRRPAPGSAAPGLLAHLELLARTAVAVRPLVPGWSELILRHLWLEERPSAGRPSPVRSPPGRPSQPPRPLPGRPGPGALMRPRSRVAPALPVYFRVPGPEGA